MGSEKFLTMHRRKQQRDVRRLTDLALLCRGQITAAAVLAVRSNSLNTLEAAVTYVKAHPREVEARLRSTGFQHFVRIADALDKIGQLAPQIDFERIAALERAKQPTATFFEDIIRQINSQVTRKLGLLDTIDLIFKSDAKNKSILPVTTLQLLGDLRKTSVSISRICWKIRHPFVYTLTDRRLLLGLVAIGIVALPAWYLIRVQISPLADRVASPTTIVGTDVTEMRRLFDQKELGFFDRLAQMGEFAFHTLLWIPSLFFVAAALIAAVQSYLDPGGRGYSLLKRSEKLFLDLGKSLQTHIPNLSQTPSLHINFKDIRMTGKVTTAIGSNISQNVDSKISDSYNAIRGKYDADLDKFIHNLGLFISSSENKEAVEKYNRICRELKDEKPDKDVLRITWEGLVKILPAVTSLSGTAEALFKLFQS